ncbi:SAM-dependent methyltransferase [Sphingobium sp. B2D3A]|uniref:class I SAM-dependent methyltransferase n=1 Tax=unclassified Sphingobium TaxID=2611147 RepID=UPI002224151B|nr:MULTISPECIES: class I SAM-dependent methyltransferase [unclassified Sphingobium]MCW2335946.1 SAM-dependent methyltransferase [Sphingobium sp. B2D3A]MCW2385705.1 SAM-dependent methyltransferase [Sphingobium sp. B2D3D]
MGADNSGVGISKTAEGWAGDMGRNWLANLDRLEGMIDPIGAVALARADFQPGERVIDVGCGGGGTSLAIARAVAPEGHVTGVDISSDLILSCGARATLSGLQNVSFVCADAGAAPINGAPFDRLFSRFGSMFFAGPKAAFRNLRGQVRDGGRIDLAVWAAPPENPWMQLMQQALKDLLPAPDGRPDPRAPGPFAFADTAWLGEVLAHAGFANMDVAPCLRDLPVGGPGASAQDAATFVLSAMHIGNQVAPDRMPEAQARLTAAFAPHHVPGQGVMLAGKALLVSAVAA